MVCDRSSPVWKKQRATVLTELKLLGCHNVPIIELWNKIDMMPDSETIRQQAMEASLSPSNEPLFQFNSLENAVNSPIDVHPMKYSQENSDDDIEYADLNAMLEQQTRVDPISLHGHGHDHSPQVDRAKHYTVAVSAITGEGMDEFYETLQSALNLYLEPITVFIPFHKDEGMIAQIHQQGEVDHLEYSNEGTLLTCKVPDSLRKRLSAFEIDGVVDNKR